jgi:hypothetical protein
LSVGRPFFGRFKIADSPPTTKNFFYSRIKVSKTNKVLEKQELRPKLNSFGPIAKQIKSRILRKRKAVPSVHITRTGKPVFE